MMDLVARAGRLLLTVLLPLAAGGRFALAQADGQSRAGDGTTMLRVEAVTDAGQPLGYSVVLVPAQGIERFTDASGRALLRVQAGRVLLRVKHLGYTPRDTTVEVPDGTTTTVRVALTRVSYVLDPVQVVAWPPCRRPGLPRRGGDERVRGIVEQLRQNAERYRLLTTSYPFWYLSEREFTKREPGVAPQREGFDTIRVSGRPEWRYRPGGLVSRDRSHGVNQWIMHIPVLSDLADEAFIGAHCFHVAGVEHKGDEQLLRIDIVAAQRLRSADVNVSVWLDPTDYGLRHASFTLTNTRQFPDLLHMISSVEYVEVVPGVPVMHRTTAENLVQGTTGAVTYTERQAIVLLTFEGARP
jgi:hypothetical protein